MNREAIKKTRDAIANHSIKTLGFNLETYYSVTTETFPDRSGHNCGAVACIAGWALAANGNGKRAAMGPGMADIVLGLSLEEASNLFVPTRVFLSISVEDGACMAFDKATPADAVEVLDRLLETGIVDWLPTARKIVEREKEKVNAEK